MKKIVWVNGIIAALIVTVVSSLLMWSSSGDGGQSHSAWLGYLVMVVAFSVIFIAIKQHRDQNLGGVIGFKTGLKVGLLITLMTAVCYVFAWEAFYHTGGADYMESYQTSYIEALKEKGASDNEIQAFRQEMTEFSVLYAKFYFRWFITLLEILPVGLIMTLMAAWLLKTKTTR